MDRGDPIPPMREGIEGQARLRYCDSVDGYAAKKFLVEHANSKIQVLGNYGGGRKFRDLMGAVEERLAANPQVTAQVLMSQDLLEEADRDLMRKLEDDCAGRFAFRELKTQSDFWKRRLVNVHEKMVVVDKAFVIGSAGIADHFTVRGDSASLTSLEGASLMARATGLRGTREAELVGDGGMSGHLAVRFDQLWEWAGGERVKSHAVTSSPLASETLENYDVKLHGGVSGAPKWRDRLLELIERSQEVWIANMSFSDEGVAKALASKKVHLITNGDRQGSVLAQKVVGIGSRLHYHHLSPESEVHEFHQPGGMMHKKMFVFRDGHEWTTFMGTANLNPCSAECDSELMMEISGRSMANQALAGFEADKELSVAIPAEQWTEFNTRWRRFAHNRLSGILN
jgi:phosphatidylserine/phosphatidylglycerophosphate/cardiolipin synthase-like enzyme